MRSTYIISTSGREYHAENGFSNIDFLYDVKILAIWHCFSPILAIFDCACTAPTILLLPV